MNYNKIEWAIANSFFDMISCLEVLFGLVGDKLLMLYNNFIGFFGEDYLM